MKQKKIIIIYNRPIKLPKKIFKGTIFTFLAVTISIIILGLTDNSYHYFMSRLIFSMLAYFYIIQCKVVSLYFMDQEIETDEQLFKESIDDMIEKLFKMKI